MRVHPRRIFLLALAGYFLLGGAWALALPVNGSYDEKQHIVRAYAVATGQWLPHGSAVDATGYPTEAFLGPRSLLPERADCTWYPKPPKPASCQQSVTDRSRVLMPSAAARYSPVYYLPVGLALRLSPDHTGVRWARLISALLCALLLAAATAVAGWLGNRLLLAGLVLVNTPLAVSLTGAVNPNGMEISTGILLVVGLLALISYPTSYPTGDSAGVPARDPAAGPPRWLLVLAGVASTLLLTIRHLGPVLAFGAVLAALVLAPPPRLRGLLRHRDTWLWFGGLSAAGAVFAVGWTLGSGVVDVAPLPVRAVGLTTWEIVRETATTRTDFYLRQVVAQFSYGETTVSLLLIAVWYGLFGALIVPALWFGGWRVRVAIVGVVAACATVLLALEVHFVPLVGWYAHGRYLYPLGVAAVLATALSDRFTARLAARGALPWAAPAAALVVAPLHLYALARVMTRFQVGIDAGLDPFAGSWRPVGGPWPPLLAGLAGVSLLVVTALVGSRKPAADGGRPGAGRPVVGPPAQTSTVDTSSH